MPAGGSVNVLALDGPLGYDPGGLLSVTRVLVGGSETVFALEGPLG